MSNFRTAVISGFFMALSAAAANAADLPEPLPLPSPPVLQTDDFTSGWYLRGDIGYRVDNHLDSVTNIGPVQPFNGALENPLTAGIGVGMKWSWFRTDVTLDYGFKSKFRADSIRGPRDFNTDIETVTGLFNVYGDLGTWWGITPYVGAGVGGSYLGVSDVVEGVPGPGPLGPEASNWHFAWAWMAGLSYKFSNYAIDLGYRRVMLGDALSPFNSFGNQLNFKGLSSDEVRLGLRWQL
jgi:opacity protein-like surface antigen